MADYKFDAMSESRPEEFQRKLHECHLKSAEKLRHLVRCNRGLYIKAAQYLASLEYLLPDEYVNTMKVFFKEAPVSSIEDVRAVLLEELGRPVEQLFKSFDEVPVGSASLAQVHKAVLHSGEVVAVKVQHRSVQLDAWTDFAMMELLIKTVNFFFPTFSFNWVVEETKKNLPKELDFELEGHNAEKLQELMKNFKFLKVPRVHWDLSSRRVLVMEFCEGGSVDDRAYMASHGINVNKVARMVGELYSRMIFVTGFVHCDPHPGNILVHKTSNGEVQVVMLDHGLYQQLNDDVRIAYCNLWQSILSRSPGRIREACRLFGVEEMYGLFASMVSGRSWEAVQAGIDRRKMDASESAEIQVAVSKYLPEIVVVLNRIPRPLILLFKCNELLRSIDFRLRTTGMTQSFITMSKNCARELFKHQWHRCLGSWTCRFLAVFYLVCTLITLEVHRLSLMLNANL